MREIIFTCNHCKSVIKTEHEGGRRPTLVMDMYYAPAPHFIVTNNKGEIFDFCSRKCMELGDY